MKTIVKAYHELALKLHSNTVVSKEHEQHEIVSAFMNKGYNVRLKDFTAYTQGIEDNCYIVELIR